MALAPRLELRQGQSLVLTPQLQQAIKMLQLSSLDLTAYVEQELERNPLLERDQEGSETPVDMDAPMDGDAEGEDTDWLAENVGKASESITEHVDAEPDALYPEATPHDLPQGLSSQIGIERQNGGAMSADAPDIDAFVTAERSLADHLQEQLPLCRFAGNEMLVASALVSHLDETGYLTATLGEIAERLGAPLEMTEHVHKRLTGLDPSGVFARSLSECLTIQLRERNRYDPAMAALVGNLELLARRDLPALKRLCGVDEADLTDMVSEIRELNPKPGMAFSHANVQTVVPDILVGERPDGGWGIQLNPDTLPRVLVNQTYYATVSKSARKSADRDYLTECLQDANWLVKSLEQRARTILKVATEIVRQQDGFLAYGVTHLRPLNLRTVADAISMHESTVSRVTSNKYMATPRGIYELKYFFTSAIAATGDGEAVSAEAVRHRIKELIDTETPEKVLSDDVIVNRLREAGIDIARRTVAKYREAMRIPSSVQRRREKQSTLG